MKELKTLPALALAASLLASSLSPVVAADAPTHDELFTYAAFVTDVYDGDTVTVTIDLGFGIFMTKQHLRLYGIDAPEMTGRSKAKGTKSRDRVRELIMSKNVYLRTIKDSKEKFGRYLAIIWVDGKSLNDLLIDEGLAVPYYP